MLSIISESWDCVSVRIAVLASRVGGAAVNAEQRLCQHFFFVRTHHRVCPLFARVRGFWGNVRLHERR